MTTQTLEIGGMTCGHCLRMVKQALDGMDGVTLDDLRIGKATVTFDDTRVSSEAIADAVRDAGYDVLATK
ncbi:MAG: copper chaperone [Gemmatimonas sp.]|nr:copper chaperone [Gemmatimonas sp.]